MPETHIFFIADGIRLEWQSWLLATSLAYAHRGTPDVHLHAYCGVEWLPSLSDTTHAVYAATGVTLHPLPPTPDWAKPYPHGNKIVAAAHRRGTGRAVFLDTDMVCLKPLTDLAALTMTEVAAAPEGRATWGPLDRWERAYAHFDLPMPQERLHLLRGKRERHLPYFNAGLVAFPEAPDTTGQTFGERWLETALNFDHTCAIANKRPWLDQITLPLTIARYGYAAHVLPESYNYSLSHRADYTATPDVHILHYHRSQFLEQAPQWPALLRHAFEIIPPAQHSAAQDGLRQMGLTL